MRHRPEPLTRRHPRRDGIGGPATDDVARATFPAGPSGHDRHTQRSHRARKYSAEGLSGSYVKATARPRRSARRPPRAVQQWGIVARRSSVRIGATMDHLSVTVLWNLSASAENEEARSARDRARDHRRGDRARSGPVWVGVPSSSRLVGVSPVALASETSAALDDVGKNVELTPHPGVRRRSDSGRAHPPLGWPADPRCRRHA